MKIKTKQFSAMLAFGVLGLGLMLPSCKHDDDHDHEGELITTVKLKLTRSDGQEQQAIWKDLTPNEPSGISVDTLRLDSGFVYSGVVELLDETQNPAKNRTEEIEREKNEHLFVYKQLNPSAPALWNLEIQDRDSRNLPVGLRFTLRTLQRNKARLQVILKHQTKNSKDGTEGPGDVDINVEFPVKIN